MADHRRTTLTWKSFQSDMRAALGRPAPPRSTLGGVQIVEDPNMVERVLHARSPARARRRMRRGYPQHYAWRPMQRAYSMPDGKLVMHPEMAAAVRARVAAMGVADAG